MTSIAFDIFDRMIKQVELVEHAADAAEVGGSNEQAAALRRAGFLLAVASIDAYFREQAASLLTAQVGAGHAASVASYLRVQKRKLVAPHVETRVRIALSLMTLVSPKKIDAMITAAGRDPEDCWDAVGLSAVQLPDRIHKTLDLVYLRRNQIAHEGDWESSSVDFRPIAAHDLTACKALARWIAAGMDSVL